MLVVRVPDSYINERTYIVQTLMGYLWNLDVEILAENRRDVLIEDPSTYDNKKLHISDILFQFPENQWLKAESLPQPPLKRWNVDIELRGIPLIDYQLPVIYGIESMLESGHSSYLVEDENCLFLGLDIFGSAFFMLTRYEEYVKPDRDMHGRFPAAASLAFQEVFLDRPIINEYIEILWWCLKRLWPGLERKKRSFRTVLSHDVDVPFAQAFNGVSQLVRNCGGDILWRHSAQLAFRRLKSWQAIKAGDYKQDLNYTFDRLMDISEKNNLRSAFYFKTDVTNTSYDSYYSIDHPYMRQLLRDIHRRGHEIGLHPSYETYQNPKQTKVEFEKLLKVCEAEGIHQDEWGGRQHYLRWQNPITWRNWSDAGVNYDSSLAYAEHAGFRCGICYEYPAFDLEQRKKLNLMEHPLIMMEGSVLGKQYMGCNKTEAIEYITKLKRMCQMVDGEFTLLWHNNYFASMEMWNVFEEIICA